MRRDVILIAPGRNRSAWQVFGLTSALPWGELMVGALFLLVCALA